MSGGSRPKIQVQFKQKNLDSCLRVQEKKFVWKSEEETTQRIRARRLQHEDERIQLHEELYLQKSKFVWRVEN
ncbi:hypothetical protein Nepgr_013842 [Nepenthes gracilis]|uniref:Uncharacterized protein n=1 Tax=Nepenthes gracilis TaxID=150966 RepID=A0AAD3XPR5_NEPGR|nr:hypothetical protein Nepgr_013842 [Nepenthes gracilis]